MPTTNSKAMRFGLRLNTTASHDFRKYATILSGRSARDVSSVRMK